MPPTVPGNPSKTLKPPKQTRAAIYGRTSTPKQKSIPQQVDLCVRRCREVGYPVRYILKEPGFKAKDVDRPMLQRLLQLVRERRIDVIVVWKLDRLVRSLQHLLNLHAFLQTYGVGLLSLTEQFDTASSFGRFNFRNIASAAELERDLISERGQLGRYSMALAGRWPHNVPPYGYDLGDDRRLVVNKPEAANVGLMFRWYADGKPQPEITRQLGERGVTTKQGRSISVTLVGKILHNDIYRGKLRIMSIEHDRPDLVLVPEGIWTRCQDRKKRRDDNSDARRKSAADAIVDDYLAYLEAEDTEAQQPTAGGAL
jgi:site-specific DNA recombinase